MLNMHFLGAKATKALEFGAFSIFWVRKGSMMHYVVGATFTSISLLVLELIVSYSLHHCCQNDPVLIFCERSKYVTFDLDCVIQRGARLMRNAEMLKQQFYSRTLRVWSRICTSLLSVHYSC